MGRRLVIGRTVERGAREATPSNGPGARSHPLTRRGQVDALQRTLGNRALQRLLGPPPASGSERTSGLPEELKAGIENLSGVSMEGVSVRYNSPEPTRVRAHAFAQGSEIHLAPSQERHLPHEAWHLVQQRQGRVRPTTRLGTVAINDDVALEREADAMGSRARQQGRAALSDPRPTSRRGSTATDLPDSLDP